MKKLYYLFYIIFLIIIIINFLSITSFAAYPKLVSTITNAFDKVKTWLLNIATPAAAVAVGTGVFMKKFSFGDEERLRTGKRLIRGSLFSYAFILCIDLILSAIRLLVSYDVGGE